MAGLEPWGAILKIEETDNWLLKLGEYALRKCGGFLWPILYGFLFFYGRSSLSPVGQSIFVVIGIPLIGIAVLYPYAWKRFYVKMGNEHKDTVEQDVRELFETIRMQCLAEPIMVLGRPIYGAYQRNVEKLERSLKRFREKYVPK